MKIVNTLVVRLNTYLLNLKYLFSTMGFLTSVGVESSNYLELFLSLTDLFRQGSVRSVGARDQFP